MWFSRSPNAEAYNQLWGTKLSYNFGLEYKRFFDPSLSLSTGIMYMNKGFRNVDPFAGTGGKSAVTLMSAHIAAVPLYLNIHQRIKRKVEMIYTIGVAGGYLFAERARNKNYSDEAVPNQGILDVTKEKSNLNLFNDVYVGAHAGIGISAYLKSRVVLVVQPMFKFQINNARDYLGQFASGDPFNARLNSFGLDLRLGYFFTKQVRNRKKEI
ncbi:MAG: hypothetical protein Salg2KO_01940 [Salibacteraceae bacterium]